MVFFGCCWIFFLGFMCVWKFFFKFDWISNWFVLPSWYGNGGGGGGGGCSCCGVMDFSGNMRARQRDWKRDIETKSLNEIRSSVLINNLDRLHIFRPPNIVGILGGLIETTESDTHVRDHFHMNARFSINVVLLLFCFVSYSSLHFPFWYNVLNGNWCGFFVLNEHKTVQIICKIEYRSIFSWCLYWLQFPLIKWTWVDDENKW